jgi:predicted nucleotidyltransferase
MLTLDIPEVTEDLLDQMVQTIVDKFHPQKVILFGSHAWGTPRKESDVDLLIIIESNLRPAQRSAEISIASRPRNLAVDFLVLKRPLEQGRVLYAQ